jgi:hypothetical protein
LHLGDAIHGLLRLGSGLHFAGFAEGELRVTLRSDQDVIGPLVVAVRHEALGLGNPFLRELQVKLTLRVGGRAVVLRAPCGSLGVGETLDGRWVAGTGSRPDKGSRSKK